MADFTFLQDPTTHHWTILASKRAKRPHATEAFGDGSTDTISLCPFCPGREAQEKEVYSISGIAGNTSTTGTTGSPKARDTCDTRDTHDTLDSAWLVRVIPNKFPFAPIHELVIHSPDHHKNFDELPVSQVELIFKTYRHRYNEHSYKGQVYIFHNRGEAGGESIPHPHSQIVVIPFEVKMDIPRLAGTTKNKFEIRSTKLQTNPKDQNSNIQNVSDFYIRDSSFSILCPESSQWPDEVWIAPKKREAWFGEITDEQITDLAQTLTRLIHILDLRHGHEFPFNFYIYPGRDWYLRLIPRQKTLGGFEIGTGIFVNTQDPKETIAFLKEHFHNPNQEKIQLKHRALYPTGI